jgi:hypothetical protein
MATDLFCVTYRKDARWLEYMLRSIRKYARGFRQTVVVYPRADADSIGPIVARHPQVLGVQFDQGPDGHLDQNAIKTSADQYSDADFFLHIDSDCVFTESATPLDYATDGRPDIWWEFYSELGPDKVPGGVPWQGITENALGFSVEIETMRRFPFLYPRWLYAETRQRIETRHGRSLLEYVRTAPKLGKAFHGYSEFNALGCMAFYQFPDQFSFHHVSDTAVKPAKMRQYWSHSGLTPAEEAELQRITSGYDQLPA